MIELKIAAEKMKIRFRDIATSSLRAGPEAHDTPSGPITAIFGPNIIPGLEDPNRPDSGLKAPSRDDRRPAWKETSRSQ
jgi:hypothetical protein